MTEPEPPTVAAPMDGWRTVERYVEPVFELAAARVLGHTAVYEDRAVTEAAAAVGLPEQPWRFLFVTRLEFVPSILPGIGTAAIYGTVAGEAARSFAEDLRQRGFERVDRERRERIRVDGARARLTRFTAAYSPDGDDPVDLEGWLAVWASDGEFRLAGGAYPVSGLDRLDPDGQRGFGRGRFREELLDLVRSVE